MMVPNTPGGGYDITARTAVKITETSGITSKVPVFNIEAGGAAAMARLMNEAGNPNLMMMMGLGVLGSTVINNTDSEVTHSTPIARLTDEQEAVMVTANSPYTTIAELAAAWNADPSGLSVGGGSAPGGPDYLMPMQLAMAVGVPPHRVRFLSYLGGGELLPALLNNRVDFATSGLGEYLEQIKSGQIRVLAVSGTHRVEGIDAPTLIESGINLVFTNWRGIIAPPGIGDVDKQRLIEIFSRLHDNAEWQSAMQKNDWSDTFLPGDDFAAFLAAEDQRIKDTLQALGLS
jgi:putative tricarboxylic transport membrane protein